MRLKVEPIKATPTDIKLHQISRIMEICFDDGKTFEIPYEYLRVYTPSAEAQGHAPGEEVLQVGKENINILEITPIGNYAVAPKFSDGHDSGIYTWALLYKLGNEQQILWPAYLKELESAGYYRIPAQNN